MRWEDFRTSDNVEDRRGDGGWSGGGGGGGGGGFGLPIPMGGRGGLGIGTIVVLGLVGWALGAQVAERVLGVVREELDRMGPDGSSIRDAFDVWVKREIERMETDPERAAEIGRAVRRVVAHETVQAWLWDVWARMRVALENDTRRPGGHTLAAIEAALHNLGAFLAEDAAARARLQAAAEGVIASMLPSGQAQVADFVGDVVAGWDAKQITDRVELRVGRDLQYVRVNGTLVGFLVGGLLFLALRAAFGHVAF